MGFTLEGYLLDRYNNRLTVPHIAQLCTCLGLTPNCTSWPEESVIGIADIMLANSPKQEVNRTPPALATPEEEESVFDYNQPIVTQGPPTTPKRQSEQVIKDIAGVISNETLFKVLCNKLFKFMEGHISDPKNPMNQFVALMPEDYGSSIGVVCLLDELCSMN